jgi:hypothetical protein
LLLEQQFGMSNFGHNSNFVYPPYPPFKSKFSRKNEKRLLKKSSEISFGSKKLQNKLPSYRCIYNSMITIIVMVGRIKKNILPEVTGIYRRKLKIILPEIKTSYLIKLLIYN